MSSPGLTKLSSWRRELSAGSEPLSRKLGYRFADSALLQEALTHRSAVGPSNERLEFLGDAVLSAVIGEALFRRYPQASEGELSRLRASLVKGTTLAKLARELCLGDHLRLGGGELKSGGFRRESTLADALEALFGAVYLDGGFAAAREVIITLFDRRLQQLPPVSRLKDPKTRLQEYLQASQQPLPLYSVIETSGADHAREYTVRCQAAQLSTTAVGRSRRQAEQAAAAELLTRLEQRLAG